MHTRMEVLIPGLHEFPDEATRPFVRGSGPTTLLVTCCDARLEIAGVTGQGRREVLVVRNVGGIVPPHEAACASERAALEYAVSVLRVHDIVVCGHSHCGAMSAVAHRTPLVNLPALSVWLRHAAPTQRLVEAHYAELTGSRRVMATTQENVLVQLEHLASHPCVQEARAEQRLRLHGWVACVDDGDVFAYEQLQAQFRARPPAHGRRAARRQPERSVARAGEMGG